MMMIGTGIGVIFAVVIALIVIAFMFRKVVPPNEVHIVQGVKKTTSYGKDKSDGNVYYNFPSFMPLIGVETVKFPVSIFDLSFEDYTAYDKEKVPFDVDITAFFAISDSNTAAQKVKDVEELKSQLRAIVQGAVRTTLAKSDIEQIMLDRAVFGAQFTKEVQDELKAWGVEAVKSIELMDIRDAEDSKVIQNIQKKKKSNIEAESRKEVARNNRDAEMAEIEAQKEVDLEDQKSKELVGKRTVEAERVVAIANQEKEQLIKEQEKLTKEREMEVLKVARIKEAEIKKEETLVRENETKEAKLIKANADKEYRTIQAEADLDVETKNKEAEKVKSEGILVAKENEAKGIAAEGKARAAAAKEMEMAPVEAQLALAKEIGDNEGYQKYLVDLKKVDAMENVGMEQAKALGDADVKVIANSESPTSGLNNVMDLFSSKGGVEMGAMFEGFAATEAGQKTLKKLGLSPDTKEAPVVDEDVTDKK